MKILLVERRENSASASVYEDIDLEKCFATWKLDFHQALKRGVIRANPNKTNREIAAILTTAGIYSKHANIVDVEIQVGKVRRKLKEKNGS